MSLSNANNRNDYVGNGAVDTYNYTFRIFDEDDIRVLVRNTSDVETTLTKTTDYTVTGVGASGGGTIVLVNASQSWLDAGGDLLTDYVLTIRRVLSVVQETDIRNQGAFYPEIHEDQFDKLVMIAQQQQDELDRSFKLPQTILASTFDTTMPASMVGNAGAQLLVNATGDGFDTGATVVSIAAHEADTTNIHGITDTSLLLDTTNTKTVTNKSMSGATNTFTAIPLSTAVTGTLPVANGGTGQSTYTNGQLLIGNTTGNTLDKATLTAGTGITITNGSGTISIASTATDPTVQTFTSGTAATYTTPANCTRIDVEIVGGGAGGGGCASSAAAAGAAGGGGGGGYCFKRYNSPAATYTYTVGAAGTGGAAGNNNGTNGGNTTFDVMTAGGGNLGFGSGAAASPSFVAGGGGGTASGGDINIGGGAGGHGAKGSANEAYGGHGGSSFFAGQIIGAIDATAAGNPGNGNGGGGAGGVNINNGGTRAGGDGTVGLIRVTEYY